MLLKNISFPAPLKCKPRNILGAEEHFYFLTIQVIFLKLLNSESTIPGAKDHSAVNNSKDVKEKTFQGKLLV